MVRFAESSFILLSARRQAIFVVPRTGLRWSDLPVELGWGCGKVCRQRLRDWHEAGMRVTLHAVLLAALNEAGKLDGSRVATDSSKARAFNGGDKLAVGLSLHSMLDLASLYR